MANKSDNRPLVRVLSKISAGNGTFDDACRIMDIVREAVLYAGIAGFALGMLAIWLIGLL